MPIPVERSLSKRAHTFSSEKVFLFTYFILIILLGSLLLYLPFSWKGTEKLTYIDALFTSVSAVCVTGLITVDTALYSTFGQFVIMLLIQAGGLGIILFSTLYLLLPGRRISFKHMRIIKDYYIDIVEHEPKHIIRNILIFTFGIEFLGSIVLYWQFKDLDRGIFTAVFHSVSAFCNAGFSIFSENLEGYATNAPLQITIMLLIITGGISFVVLQDVFHSIFEKKHKLTLHSKIVLSVSAVLIVTGTLTFYFFERRHTLRGIEEGYKILNSIFLSITPRTAGFNTLSMQSLTVETKAVNLLLMFIGGAPGSIAGGIKVTTFFLITLIAFKSLDENGEIRIARRKLGTKTLSHASMFIIKAFLILFTAIFALTISESNALLLKKETFLDIVFESVSAFGTVGLSLGITSSLSIAGKIIIILTMFAGRVGLFAIAIPVPGKHIERFVDYPEGEVMIG